MSNISISIKVVSQLQKLEYHGVAQSAENAAASRMNALLFGKTQKESSQIRNSESYVLYQSQATDPDQGNMPSDTDEHTKPVAFAFKEALEMFNGFASDDATQARKNFFTAVENGKKALREKYGEDIPKVEFLNLAKETRSLATTVWKHQIVTTRTESSPFEGSRPNKGGTFTATVKSKTIYTYRPLTQDQIEALKSVILALKSPSETGYVCRRDAVSLPTGVVRTWISETGSVVLKEPKNRSSTSIRG